MNRHRKKGLIAIQLCTIVLMNLWVAASAGRQMPATSPATNDRSEMTAVPSFVSRFRTSFGSLSWPLRPANGICTNVDKEVPKAFGKAWRFACDGNSDHEGVVLIFRLKGGSYTGRLQRFTNEHKQATFKWNPAAVAIVHTHPNHTDPKPSEQDRRVADKYGIPNFTITNSGMYVYDPATKQTSKVLNGLDWLNLSPCPDERNGWRID